METQIKIVRLKTGDDLIGHIQEESYSYRINDAMVIEFHTDMKARSQVVTLVSWAPYNIIKKNECVIHESDILTMFEPTEMLVEHYKDTLRSISNVEKAKEEAENLSDNEILEMIQAMRESVDTTVH